MFVNTLYKLSYKILYLQSTNLSAPTALKTVRNGWAGAEGVTDFRNNNMKQLSCGRDYGEEGPSDILMNIVRDIEL